TRRLCGTQRLFGFALVWPRGQAFTFVELLIVCAIIAVLSGIAAPMLGRAVPGLMVSSSGRKAAAYLKFLSSTAASGNRIIVLSIDSGSGRLTARDGEDKKEISSLVIPSGLTVQSTAKEIIFYPDGTCDRFSLGITGNGRAISIMPSGYGRFSANET
ncbi:MAG: prepilin-type N-terminal cleavage/methylation domain-containing protein, partial [Deltaproteobacteria bacterium]